MGSGYKADKPAGQPAGGRKVPISRSIDIKVCALKGQFEKNITSQNNF